MKYVVKELYYTLQGEGINVGRPAVFLRFTGCNLWSGLEKDRGNAICQFCDTDFVGTDGPGGGIFTSAGSLAESVRAEWPTNGALKTRPLVVCTGGEPLLQLDEPLVDALHAAGFDVAIETNGTQVPPPGIDWICVSPKAGAPLKIHRGNELKLVFPQCGAEPDLYENLDFDHFLLQPMYGSTVAANTELAIAYCKTHPRWRLSLQTHKILRIP
jgi:7-carboxy-7-deazaguanine synthase (Cx14CxxC type)